MPKKFRISVAVTTADAFEVEAETPEAAVLQALELRGVAGQIVDAEQFDGPGCWDVVGCCEGCHAVLLDPPSPEERIAMSTADDVYVCPECYAAAASDEAAP
jgi:hypothetical protein